MLSTTVNTDELTRQILQSLRYKIYCLRMTLADTECSKITLVRERAMSAELAACVLVYVRLSKLGEIDE